jgi:hypothetical protein
MVITEEAMERRRHAAELMVLLTGIDTNHTYIPGIVTLHETLGILPEFPDRKLIMVSWKIDDLMWVIKTKDQAFISANDDEARTGVHSFTADSSSWHWGIAPFLERSEAVALRDRVVHLTKEFGLNIESYEATLRRT